MRGCGFMGEKCGRFPGMSMLKMRLLRADAFKSQYFEAFRFERTSVVFCPSKKFQVGKNKMRQHHSALSRISQFAIFRGRVKNGAGSTQLAPTRGARGRRRRSSGTVRWSQTRNANRRGRRLAAREGACAPHWQGPGHSDSHVCMYYFDVPCRHPTRK